MPPARVGDAVHLAGLSPVATGGYAARRVLEKPNGLSADLAALTLRAEATGDLRMRGCAGIVQQVIDGAPLLSRVRRPDDPSQRVVTGAGRVRYLATCSN